MTPPPVQALPGIEERNHQVSLFVCKRNGEQLATRMQDCNESWWSSHRADQGR